MQFFTLPTGKGIGQEAVMSTVGRIGSDGSIDQRGRKAAMAQSFFESEEIDACLQ